MKFVVCHRIPERCFLWRGRRLPICSRCCGVFGGQALGLIAAFWPVPWWVCLSLILPLLIDWGLQRFRLMASTNSRRFVTGLLAGFGEVALVVAVVVLIKRMF
jgi:uncharacterized membrane protein